MPICELGGQSQRKQERLGFKGQINRCLIQERVKNEAPKVGLLTLTESANQDNWFIFCCVSCSLIFPSHFSAPFQSWLSSAIVKSCSCVTFQTSPCPIHPIELNAHNLPVWNIILYISLLNPKYCQWLPLSKNKVQTSGGFSVPSVVWSWLCFRLHFLWSVSTQAPRLILGPDYTCFFQDACEPCFPFQIVSLSCSACVDFTMEDHSNTPSLKLLPPCNSWNTSYKNSKSAFHLFLLYRAEGIA